MSLDPAQFRHEYDLEALELIRPQGCDFQMLVTPRYLEHYVANRYEAFSAALVGARSTSRRLFVDVGAHYGFFSLLVASRNPGIEIVALEPVPETHEVLVRNLALNGLAGCEPHLRALSDRPERSLFHRSLSSDNCGFYPHPVAPPIGVIEVVTTTVDELLAGREPCPTLVKIDTDGHELPVLAGMADTLARFPDLELLVELNPKMQRLAGHEPEELVAELGRLGFDAYLLDEALGRAYRLKRPAAWRELMNRPENDVNLFCCRRETSLSVCFFSHSSALCGAERSLLELATELVEDHGAICTVVLPDDGPLRRRLERAGVATLVTPYPWWCDTPYDLRGPEPLEGGFSERLRPSVLKLLGEPCRELRRIDPDILVTHTLAIPWGALLAPVLGKPHVWHVCEFGELDADLRFLLPFPDVVALVRESSSYVFTASDAIRARLFPEADESRCRTLYRHIEVAGGPGAGDSCGLFTKPSAFRLALFGQYSPGKGQDLAIEAVARLTERGRSVELLLAGHGRDRFEGKLQELVERFGLEDSVRLADFIEDVYPVMLETDVILIGSRMEAFGRVAVEAMLLGKPVVYPDRGGPAEYLEDGTTGLAYAAGDPHAMAAAIERLIADPDLRAKLGRQAREHARAKFTREGYGGTAVQILRGLRDAEPRTAARWASLLAATVEGLVEENRRLGEQAAASAAAALTAREEARAFAADLRTRTAAELAAAAADLAAAEERNRALHRELADARDVLEAVLGGATWTVAVRLRRPLDLAAPVGSRRRELLKRLVQRSRRRFSRPR